MSEAKHPALLAFVIDNSLLLVFGTVIALVWANLGHDSYERFVHPLHFVVNDIGMVFFFALATKEILDATLPGGALSSPREAGVPLLAALGGMLGPALLFALQVRVFGQPELVRGWAIPCATDIAFSYMAARLIFPKEHPTIPFFGLVNAGVAASSVGPGTWIVLSSLLVGKPLGILALTFVAVQCGLRRPGGLRYQHVIVLGLAAGMGFSVALFFATAAFAPGAVLEEAKMGALLSFVAAPVAIAAGRLSGLRPRPNAAVVE